MQAPEKGEKHSPPYRLCKLYHYDYNPGKTWLLEFYQWNVVAQRKERRFFSKFNNIKDPKKRLIEAEKWERFINQQLENGAVYNPSIKKAEPVETTAKKEPSFINELANYLDYQKPVLAENSHKAYRMFVDKWKAYAKSAGLEDLKTKDLTPAICNDFVHYLVRLPISNSSRNSMIARLKVACNFFAEPGRERYSVSPARHIKDFPSSSEMHEPFTDLEADQVFSEIRKRQDWQLLLFVYFVHYTFARPGQEVRLLRVKDLRDRSVVYRAKYNKTDITKTPTIPKPLEQLIEQLSIRNYDPDFYIFGKGGKPGLTVISMSALYSRHARILRDLKIVGKHTLYSWKHTGNIKLFRADVNLKAIQQQNGHSNLRSTEVYLRKLGTFIDNDIYEKFK
ncbi:MULTISPECIES: site-specific integrase [unclassified Spirosoma]|uniref:tyrosine-type recombinase/integrase n=1 Tax=unclassified Spirosoma TaxID=2621999 RepID=UPI0025D6D908|nr:MULTISPECIES: site-specific integrase [unclassified Spirosoma]